MIAIIFAYNCSPKITKLYQWLILSLKTPNRWIGAHGRQMDFADHPILRPA
jgi:hypothetical protein